MKSCHSCRFFLPNGEAAHTRCLVFYNMAVANVRVKEGLAGDCHEYIAEPPKIAIKCNH